MRGYVDKTEFIKNYKHRSLLFFKLLDSKIMVVIFYFPVTSNPCDAPVNPCLSDGVSHTCRLQAGGAFKCKCKDGYVNDAAGKYCVSK